MVISKHAKFKGFPFKMSAPEQKRSNKLGLDVKEN
jgi:hypothetical protein